MMGCYIFFEDGATRDFFLSRVKTERVSPVGKA